jgi:hypothetical protein
VIVVPIVVTPSIGVDVPVNVRVVEVAICGIPVDVVPVNVTNVAPVDVAPVDTATVDIAPVDVTGRSVSDSRPRTAATPSDAGFRYCQGHATHHQNRENYDDPSHVSFLFWKISLSSNLRRFQAPNLWPGAFAHGFPVPSKKHSDKPVLHRLGAGLSHY